MMNIEGRGQNRAFTLLEIMIVVALIGLLAVMALPSFMKVRKQSQGKRIVSDARVIDTAIDAWAMEKNKADGDVVDVIAIGAYSKSGQINTRDSLGNLFDITLVGTNQVKISSNTKSALAGVHIDWGAY
jgi:prepilin-type N-terminal cleavage/methylation domain-containing protein